MGSIGHSVDSSFAVNVSAAGDELYRNVSRPWAPNGTFTSDHDSITLQAAEALKVTGIVIGVVSIFSNIVFLIALRFLQDNSSPYYRLMKSLAVSDIMASFLFLLTQHYPRGPFARVQRDQHFMLQDGLPYVFRSMPWMFFTGYLFTLTCLTVHQYVAVCKPWKYSEMVTKKMISKSLLIVWSTSSLQVIVPTIVVIVLLTFRDKVAAKVALYYVSKVEIQVWMAIFALTAVVNIILDAVVYKKIKILKHKRRNLHVGNQESLNIKMKQEAFITVSLLLLASIFCRLPFPLFSIVGINLEKVIDPYTIVLLNALISLLLFVNFSADPIIYVLRMKDLRKAVRARRLVCFDSGRGKHAEAGSGVPLGDVLLPRQIAQSTATTGTEMCGLKTDSDDRAKETVLEDMV